MVTDNLQATLNDFAALPKDTRYKIRRMIIAILSSSDSILFTDDSLNAKAFYPLDSVISHLPMRIPAYTDFSCCEEHVGNVCVRARR